MYPGLDDFARINAQNKKRPPSLVPMKRPNLNYLVFNPKNEYFHKFHNNVSEYNNLIIFVHIVSSTSKASYCAFKYSGNSESVILIFLFCSLSFSFFLFFYQFFAGLCKTHFLFQNLILFIWLGYQIKIPFWHKLLFSIWFIVHSVN